MTARSPDFEDLPSDRGLGKFPSNDRGKIKANPPGITVIADGRDVGGTHSSTHYTIYPRQEMLFTEFVSKFLDCGWVYVGKKELR